MFILSRKNQNLIGLPFYNDKLLPKEKCKSDREIILAQTCICVSQGKNQLFKLL